MYAACTTLVCTTHAHEKKNNQPKQQGVVAVHSVDFTLFHAVSLFLSPFSDTACIVRSEKAYKCAQCPGASP